MIILKIGGGKAINWDYIARDITTLKEPIIIVHGANHLMKDVSVRLGVTEKIITSPSGHVSRYTDEKTMEILLMTYSGLMNKKIVSKLQKNGINAIGLSGVDGKLWLGKRKDVILSEEKGKVKTIRDSFTGNVVSVNIDLLKLLVNNGYTPVMTIPAITEDGELINVDNDRAIAIIVRDLGIKKVVMLFEAPGLLENLNDPSSRIKHIDKNDLDSYTGKTEGRMRKKLLGVKEAFSYGAQFFYFGDGRINHPITSALKGEGTIIS